MKEFLLLFIFISSISFQQNIFSQIFVALGIRNDSNQSEAIIQLKNHHTTSVKKKIIATQTVNQLLSKTIGKINIPHTWTNTNCRLSNF